MDIKTYIKQHKIRIADLSKKAGIPYTTVGDIINGKTDIDNVSVKVLIHLSKALALSTEAFYRMAKEVSPTPKLPDNYSLRLKNGRYYISFKREEAFLCDNTPLNARYIKDIANTYIKNREAEKRMNSWQMML